MAFERSNYASEFLSAPARDGQQVPVSLAYRKGTPLDGTAPLFQYGYGSYGYSEDAGFDRDRVSLLDRGFVVAIAHVRGGQELGRRWYEDGRLLNKKNTFTDFIDVTRAPGPEGLWREGQGLRRGRQRRRPADGRRRQHGARPSTAASSPTCPSSTWSPPCSTRASRSPTNEFDEWGNPQQKVAYDYMLSYSPYDNVAAQDYPAMLVFTGLWDFTGAVLRARQVGRAVAGEETDDRPLIFSIDMNAGHPGQAGRYQQYRDTALEYAFILDQLATQP